MQAVETELTIDQLKLELISQIMETSDLATLKQIKQEMADAASVVSEPPAWYAGVKEQMELHKKGLLKLYPHDEVMKMLDEEDEAEE